MLKKLLLVVSAIFVGIACLCFGESAQAPAPVPPDVAISSPDQSRPEEIKSLSGKWVGRWKSRLGWDAVLYIEEINRNSAKVVFAGGNTTRL
jgi:hypothetical protein